MEGLGIAQRRRLGLPRPPLDPSANLSRSREQRSRWCARLPCRTSTDWCIRQACCSTCGLTGASPRAATDLCGQLDRTSRARPTANGGVLPHGVMLGADRSCRGFGHARSECLTFDMSGGTKRAKHALGRPLDGGVRPGERRHTVPQQVRACQRPQDALAMHRCSHERTDCLEWPEDPSRRSARTKAEPLL
jgi:hypothetical protein